MIRIDVMSETEYRTFVTEVNNLKRRIIHLEAEAETMQKTLLEHDAVLNQKVIIKEITQMTAFNPGNLLNTQMPPKHEQQFYGVWRTDTGQIVEIKGFHPETGRHDAGYVGPYKDITHYFDMQGIEKDTGIKLVRNLSVEADR